MWPYIISTIAVVLLITIMLVVQKINQTKARKEIITLLMQEGNITEANEKSHDFIYDNNGVTAYVKLINIGHVKEFSVNSKRHWQVKKSGSSYLLPTGGFEDLEDNKIIIVYPKPLKMVKYINENEIVFVKAEDLSFDFYLFTKDDIKQINNIIK